MLALKNLQIRTLAYQIPQHLIYSYFCNIVLEIGLSQFGKRETVNVQ